MSKTSNQADGGMAAEANPKTERRVSRQAIHASQKYVSTVISRPVSERLDIYLKARGIKRLWAVTRAVEMWLDAMERQEVAK